MNTVGGRDPAGAAIRDKIGGYEDLLAWSVLAGIGGPPARRERWPGWRRRTPGGGGRAGAGHPAARRPFRIFECRDRGPPAAGADAEMLRRELSIARRASGYFPRTPAVLRGHFRSRPPR